MEPSEGWEIETDGVEDWEEAPEEPDEVGVELEAGGDELGAELDVGADGVAEGAGVMDATAGVALVAGAAWCAALWTACFLAEE